MSIIPYGVSERGPVSSAQACLFPFLERMHHSELFWSVSLVAKREEVRERGCKGRGEETCALKPNYAH